MLLNLRRSVVVSIVLFVICGLAYPALVTGIGQVFFKSQANGSLTPLGSTLVGQPWKGPQWFQGRPDPYNPMATGAQNYGPKSRLLLDFATEQAAALENKGITPTSGLVTGSGSGIDPDISPQDAYAQVSAVAKANGLSSATVRALVRSHITGRYWGFLGAPYVNVMSLNKSLADLHH